MKINPTALGDRNALHINIKSIANSYAFQFLACRSIAMDATPIMEYGRALFLRTANQNRRAQIYFGCAGNDTSAAGCGRNDQHDNDVVVLVPSSTVSTRLPFSTSNQSNDAHEALPDAKKRIFLNAANQGFFLCVS